MTAVDPSLEMTSDSALQELGRRSNWFLALGVIMVALGAFVLSWSCLVTVTVTATWLFGFLLLGSGIFSIINAFSAGQGRGVFVHLLVGVMYAVAGFMMIDAPGESAILLTKIFSIFLIVGGAFRILSALLERFPGWGWVMLNGAITLVLGLLIYKQWPVSGLWFIGMAVAIDMIFNGWTLIMLSLGVKQLSKVKTT